jgi:hypothetical protein
VTSDEEGEPLAQVLASKVSVPEHVVARAFAGETVVLNLHTGKYHGLDPVAGRLFDMLPRSGSVSLAAQELAREYEQPEEEVARDVVDFCLELRERGLITLVEP